MSDTHTKPAPIGHNRPPKKISAPSPDDIRGAVMRDEAKRLGSLLPHQRAEDVLNITLAHAAHMNASKRYGGVVITTMLAIGKLSNNPSGLCYAGIAGLTALVFTYETPPDAATMWRDREKVERALEVLEREGRVLTETVSGRASLRVLAPIATITNAVTETCTPPGVTPGNPPPGSETRGVANSYLPGVTPGSLKNNLPGVNSANLPGVTPGTREGSKEKVLEKVTSAHAPWDNHDEPSTVLDLQGGETDDDNALPDFVSKGSRGSLIAQIPWTSADGKKSGIKPVTITKRDRDTIAARLKITSREARGSVIDTFEYWHGAGKTGFKDPTAEFIADCVARHRAHNVTDDEPTVITDFARMKAEYDALDSDPYAPEPPPEAEAMREVTHGTKH